MKLQIKFQHTKVELKRNYEAFSGHSQNKSRRQLSVAEISKKPTVANSVVSNDDDRSNQNKLCFPIKLALQLFRSRFFLTDLPFQAYLILCSELPELKFRYEASCAVLLFGDTNRFGHCCSKSLNYLSLIGIFSEGAS